MMATGDKSWQGSMDVLKSNSVNLIKSIDKLVAAVNRFWTGGECWIVYPLYMHCVHLHACR